MENEDNVELRSEKVRKVIGRIPPLLIRTGTAVITMLVIGMIWGAIRIHFPMTINGQGSVNNYKWMDKSFYYANINIPYKYLYMFYGQKRIYRVTFEGLPDNVYYTSKDTPKVDANVKEHDGEKFFTIFIKIDNSWARQNRLKMNQGAKAITVVSDKTIWNLVFHKQPAAS